MINEELAKDIGLWKRLRDKVLETIKCRKQMYPDLNETLEELVSSHGLPTVCPYNLESARLLPKLIAELELLNFVVEQLHDDRTEAAKVLALVRERAWFLEKFEEIHHMSKSGDLGSITTGRIKVLTGKVLQVAHSTPKI